MLARAVRATRTSEPREHVSQSSVHEIADKRELEQIVAVDAELCFIGLANLVHHDNQIIEEAH